ncbi:MAG: hypothetical protein EGQ81_08275 [Akkermansia sp.]|nr:hypothetical protein [Akkermansia sp.]
MGKVAVSRDFATAGYGFLGCIFSGKSCRKDSASRIRGKAIEGFTKIRAEKVAEKPDRISRAR